MPYKADSADLGNPFSCDWNLPQLTPHLYIYIYYIYIYIYIYIVNCYYKHTQSLDYAI